MLTDLEYAFLCAGQEAMTRQQEMISLLAADLGTQPEKVFYHWVIPPRCQSVGTFAGGEWRYFFHGLECDLKNTRDGRFLRVEFGPKGRLDTFSAYGTLQFVMTTQAPWREFPELKTFLAEKPPPYNELSGSHERMSLLINRIAELELIEVADPDLRALVNKHTRLENGVSVISLPEGFNDPNQPAFWDTLLCRRRVFSELGRRVIAGRPGSVE